MTTHPTEPALLCSCCHRPYPRRRLHALGESAYICRRCGFYVAFRLKRDPQH